jgi:hypothetical protein
MLGSTVDYRLDSHGKDPDKFSALLKTHHQVLWSKPLPNGEMFGLVPDATNYLVHKSSLGEFFLSSDAISNSLRHQKRMAHIISQVHSQELDAFQAAGATTGAVIVFPGNKVNGGLTINVARGFNARIGDRFDLTLECVRRHYLGQTSPLEETLNRYKDFFSLFASFAGYVEFFHLQDLVDGQTVRFFLPFQQDFSSKANPLNLNEYLDYKKAVMDFVAARNRRIEALSLSY